MKKILPAGLLSSLLGGAAVLALGCILAWSVMSKPAFDDERLLALLVPDDYQENAVRIWRQAASEEGIRLEVLTTGALLRHSGRAYAGIIVPDTIHRSGSNSVTDALKDYVQRGGKMMLVFDALTLDANGAYPVQAARLSDLAGIQYALYGDLREGTIVRGAVVTNARTAQRIGITPGRYEIGDTRVYGNWPYDHWLTTYRYRNLDYSFFTTGKAAVDAEVLMVSAAGDVAALTHRSGKGATLFVNLPLGLLKNSTDGFLLHSFLRYFSDELVGLPRLLDTPDGVGGMILNIHVDNGYAIKSLDTLKDIGLLDQGPYSFHFTAGPDVDEPGDGMGMDAADNTETKDWILALAAQGHAIGNHGGWIHNYFGTHITESNGAEYVNYLDLNNATLRRLLKRPLKEYSAPIGNHPEWVTAWMADNHLQAYYTTSNLGMGPTRMFRNDRLIDQATWSIPITPLGHVASFEEAMVAAIAPAAVTAWLEQLADYVADQRTVRAIYCHPIGVPFYSASVQALLQKTRALKESQRFNWYTMTEAASFMSRREHVKWHVRNEQGRMQIDAHDMDSLKGMTWRIPLVQCTAPAITSGTGRIREDRQYWELIAGDVKELSVSCQAAAATR